MSPDLAHVLKKSAYNMVTAGERTTGYISSGTQIGNMTANGGVAAAFDGTTSQSAAASAGVLGATSGYVGLTLDAPTIIYGADVYGSNSGGYNNTTNSSVTLSLMAKQGSFTAPGDGTVLATTTFTDTNNESTARTLLSSDTSTAWDHVWILIEVPSSSALRCAEFDPMYITPP